MPIALLSLIALVVSVVWMHRSRFRNLLPNGWVTTKHALLFLAVHDLKSGAKSIQPSFMAKISVTSKDTHLQSPAAIVSLHVNVCFNWVDCTYPRPRVVLVGRLPGHVCVGCKTGLRCPAGVTEYFNVEVRLHQRRILRVCLWRWSGSPNLIAAYTDDTVICGETMEQAQENWRWRRGFDGDKDEPVQDRMHVCKGEWAKLNSEAQRRVRKEGMKTDDWKWSVSAVQRNRGCEKVGRNGCRKVLGVIKEYRCWMD